MGVELPIERTNTILYCDRWRATAAFYEGPLGLAVSARNDWFVEFRLTATSFVSVADASRASIGAVGGQGVTLTWQVADVTAARAVLLRKGVSTTAPHRRWGADVIYFHDPEGHRIELWSASAAQEDGGGEAPCLAHLFDDATLESRTGDVLKPSATDARWPA